MSVSNTVYSDNDCEIYSDVVGDLEVNCYFVVERKSKKCWIVDPGGDADAILDKIEREKWKPEAIINTHGHADHIGANGELKKKLLLPIWTPEGDAEMLPDPWKNLSSAYGAAIFSPSADRLLVNGEVLSLGELKFEVRHAPGHTAGEILLYRPDVLICGDVLFAQSVGRTDLPGGDGETLWNSISQKILTLPDHTVVLPGHGPQTTVIVEKKRNPFLANDGEILRDM